MDEGKQTEKELREQAQLLDAGNLNEVAAFLAGLLVSGILPNAIWDAIKGTIAAISRRFGAAKLEELEDLLVRELQKVQRKGKHLSEEDLRLRAKDLLARIQESGG